MCTLYVTDFIKMISAYIILSNARISEVLLRVDKLRDSPCTARYVCANVDAYIERESTFLLSLSFWFSLLFPLDLSLSLSLSLFPDFFLFYSLSLSTSRFLRLFSLPNTRTFAYVRARDTSLYTANIQRAQVFHPRRSHEKSHVPRKDHPPRGRKSCWFSNRAATKSWHA